MTTQSIYYNSADGNVYINSDVDIAILSRYVEGAGDEAEKIARQRTIDRVYAETLRGKSGYQTDQQDESPENEPNKQQIPPSKPGMDVAKVLYKKALITKYNNIYKPANI